MSNLGILTLSYQRLHSVLKRIHNLQAVELAGVLHVLGKKDGAAGCPILRVLCEGWDSTSLNSQDFDSLRSPRR